MAFTEKHLENLIQGALKHNASDIHLRTDESPALRISGEMIPVQSRTLDESDILDIIELLIPIDNINFNKEHDGSYEVENLCRLRFNIFKYQGKLAVILRIIKTEIPSIEDLGLNHQLKDISMHKRGLILVTGATGSGKSSTLAAMVHHINQNRYAHILSIEDPIEYLHQNIKSKITQREVGSDTKNFSTALRSALRQDPDVILIGELRDQETLAQALKAAETGHLVLSTMHTNDALSTIGRIIGMTSSEDKQDLRHRLADSLYAVIGQRLIKGRQNQMVAAQEIMVTNPGIKECIRGEEELSLIPEIIERDYAKGGGLSNSFDQSLMMLYQQGLISKDVAITNATSSSNFMQKLIVEN